MDLELLLVQCRGALWALWVVSWVAFSALVSTWRLSLRTKYLREALAREMRSNSSEQKKLIGESYKRCEQMRKELLERFLRAPTPTLSDLVESTERELQVRASRPPSAPLTPAVSENTIELNTADFTQHSRGFRATPRNDR